MKLFRNTIAVLTALCMIACMSAAGFAVNTGNFSVDYRQPEYGNYLYVTVYAHNYVGLTSGTIDVTYSGGVKYDYYSMGSEARKVNDSADNGFHADVNNTSANRVLYGFYFSDQMRDADMFAWSGMGTDRLNINVANFDLVTFTFQLDGSAYEINIDVRSLSYDGKNNDFHDTKTGGAGVITKPNGPSASERKPGDVNGDGKIGSDDARLALRCSVKLENYAAGSVQYLACDVDGDGRVTSADARMILRMSVGLDPSAASDEKPDIDPVPHGGEPDPPTTVTPAEPTTSDPAPASKSAAQTLAGFITRNGVYQSGLYLFVEEREDQGGYGLIYDPDNEAGMPFSVSLITYSDEFQYTMMIGIDASFNTYMGQLTVKSRYGGSTLLSALYLIDNENFSTTTSTACMREMQYTGSSNVRSAAREVAASSTGLALLWLCQQVNSYRLGLDYENDFHLYNIFS